MSVKQTLLVISLFTLLMVGFIISVLNDVDPTTLTLFFVTIVPALIGVANLRTSNTIKENAHEQNEKLEVIKENTNGNLSALIEKLPNKEGP